MKDDLAYNYSVMGWLKSLRSVKLPTLNPANLKWKPILFMGIYFLILGLIFISEWRYIRLGHAEIKSPDYSSIRAGFRAIVYMLLGLQFTFFALVLRKKKYSNKSSDPT